MKENITQDHQCVSTSPNPAALSLAAGFAGTVTGLKRGGVPGAIALGLASGTAGYVVGAAAENTQHASHEPASTEDPVHIDIDEEARDTDGSAETDESAKKDGPVESDTDSIADTDDEHNETETDHDDEE